MSSKSSAASSEIGTFGLLGVVFVTLKLLGITEVASWSWWWVTAPFWGGVAFVLVITAVVLLFCGIAYVAASIIEYFQR